MASLNELFQSALSLHQAGHLAEAQSLYRQVLAADARHFDSLHLLGLSLVQSGETSAGIDHMRRAIAIRNDFPEAHYNLGHALLTQGEADDALSEISRAIELNPRDAQYHLEAGNALKDLARLTEAIAAYDAAIALEPRMAEAWNNRGIALKDTGRHEEALASYDRALALQPRYVEAHSNRGNALKELRWFDESLASHDRAIALKPGYVEAHYNRGNVLSDLKRPEEALESFDAALRLNPDHAEARNNKAHLLLGQGRFPEGFADYGARWRSANAPAQPLQAGIAPWTGETGGHLLLWAEQGIGDEIFYASMLSLLPLHEMRVTLAADKRLHAIYRRSFPQIDIIDSEDVTFHAAGDFTAQAAIGDLGSVLKLDARRIGERRVPFLLADPERRAELRSQNEVLCQKPVCGIAWKSANKRFGAEKSLHLGDLAPVLAVPGMNFVNLQYGDVTDEITEVREALGITVHEAAGIDVFADLDGLMALVDCCDVVLTTSNVTAHIAGAIGKSATVLVPAGKGSLWYWQGGANNLWYPSLYRIAQDGPGNWTSAIDRAAAWIKETTWRNV